MSKLTGIDLFAGAGGLTLGLKKAGITTVCAVDFDADSAMTFAGHTSGTDILVADIRQSTVLQHLAKFRGSISLLYGGPPCQPFSSGGLRGAADDARDMIPWFVEAIRIVQPDAFLMENVPGLAVSSRFSYFGRILNTLLDEGYRVTWQILNAADFGVPQKRKRLFVVGMRGREFGFPRPTHGPGSASGYFTVHEALPPFQFGTPNPSKVFYARAPDLRPSPYDGHLFNGGGRPINHDAPAPTVLASAGGNKTHFFDDLGIAVDYHRHLMQGGKPRQGEVEGCRRLTVKESGILQTFPPEMRFFGSRSSQYAQIGNAVPPLLAASLGEALAVQLLGCQERDERYIYAKQPRLFWQG